MIKIPYGISNFETIRKDRYLYVDKTKYIEFLENDAPYQFFIRPRRFGKSLFLSMLYHYYNIGSKSKFDELFGDLYIGKNPTQKRNSYLMFHISFASLVTGQGRERFIESFDKSVQNAAVSFFETYKELFNGKILPSDLKGAESIVQYIVNAAESMNMKLFMLIDEYDNFANDLIGTGNKGLYYGLLSSEGYIRTFYKAIKDGTAKSIERVFLTGVSPIMLDDLTSGFNITINITLESRYNEMLGFTYNEVKEIINDLYVQDKFDKEVMLNDMKLYYNGYLFSEGGRERVFNSNMVLYFLNSIVTKGQYPQSMLDFNMKTDYKKIEELAFNFQDEESLQNIISQGTVTTQLVEKFNLEYMYSNKENFISLLYYMGMLTIKESMFMEYTLCIPNYVIKSIYWEYLIEKFNKKSEIDIRTKELMSSIKSMAIEGDIILLDKYLQSFINSLSNRDLIAFDEKHLKMILTTLLSMSGVYIVNSEYEVDNGYIDIFLSKNKAYSDSIKYEWIIELKYLKESNKKELEDTITSATNQIIGYSSSQKILDGYQSNRIKRLIIILVGKKEVHTKLV